MLVKILEHISAKAKATAKPNERPKSANDSIIKERRKTHEATKPYTDVEEDSSGLYSRLADLVLNLDELEPADVLSEQSILCTPESDENPDTANLEAEYPSKQSNSMPLSSSSSESAAAYTHQVPLRINPQHGSLKFVSEECSSAKKISRNTFKTRGNSDPSK